DSNAGNEHIIEAFNAFYYYHDHKTTLQTLACPPGSKNNNTIGSINCFQCKDGKTSEYVDNSKCYDCLPNYEKIIHRHNNSLECNKCQIGSIYAKPDISTSEKKCFEPKCSQNQYFDIYIKKCVECSASIPNSFERPNGSFPLYKFCSCQDNYIKVLDEWDVIKCLFNDNITEFINDKVLNPNYNYTYHYIQINENSSYTFFNCPPYKRFSFIDYYCICNRGFIYRDGGCHSYLRKREGNDGIKKNLSEKKQETIQPNATTIDKIKHNQSIDSYKSVTKEYEDKVKIEKTQDCPIFFRSQIILLISLALIIVILLIGIIFYSLKTIKKRNSRKNTVKDNRYANERK
ncbi:MAG: hypothetical protein MHPSP_003780, partial [Paramarteilia canceri]